MENSVVPLKCKKECDMFKDCRGGCYTRSIFAESKGDYMCPRLGIKM
jgi:sulfatase maturation enzyme AslB (radical SAM superfamily)